MRRARIWTGWGTAACLVLASLATAGTGAAAPHAEVSVLGDGSRIVSGDFGPAQRRALIARSTRDRARTADLLRLGRKESLVVKDVMRDADGAEHVRYNRTYAGLPVIGGDLVVHRSADGALRGTSWATRDRISVPATRAAIPASAARGNDAGLVVYAVHHRPVLAFEGHVRGFESDGTPVDDLVYTDARSGRRLGVSPNVMTDTGTGGSLYSGSVALTTTKVGTSWVLTDGSRGGQSTYDANNANNDAQGTLFTDADDVWGTGSSTSRQSAAVDAHYGAEKTWDFYKSSFGRNGIANDGIGAYSRVHFGIGYENAFWNNSCFCMTYGDGKTVFKPLVELDVAGHEMTHGVTAATDGLDYFGDAGGLNESTSDVMGTMVEFSANNASDPGDYYIGEKMMQDGTYLRRMDNPAADGRSRNCYSRSVRRLDPHFSSGVGNHLFYLLAEGSGSKTIGGRPHRSTTCNGTRLFGIGRVRAASIWYRAMTTYWTSTETYPRAANAMIRAARDLYGRGSIPCRRTVRAWKGVRVQPSVTCRTRALPTGTSANGVANPGFESGAASWAQSSAGLVTNTTRAFPHSGSWYAWLPARFTVHRDIVSQRLRVPAGGSTMLRFYLLVDTNRARRTPADPDRLRVRVKVGARTKTLKRYSNVNNTFLTYELRALDMTPYAGKRVTLRFIATSNADRFYTQYLVDDVSVVSTRR